MADHSLESLLASIKDKSSTLGWDAIYAIFGPALDRGLQQDHLVRKSEGTQIPEINGSFTVPGTTSTHYLSGFKVAAPKLSFENASMKSALTSVVMPLLSGTHMLVDEANSKKDIRRLNAFDPLDGPQILMDLTMGADGEGVRLDLKYSENVTLSMFKTTMEQLEGGALIKAELDQLDDLQRVFTLVEFPDEVNPFMSARNVDVRTQKRKTSGGEPQTINEENGAVVVFGQMEHGRAGAFPGDDTDFPFLIPDNEGEKTYAVTALFSPFLLHRAAFGHSVVQLLEGGEFDMVHDEHSGQLTKMTATGGLLEADGGSYHSPDGEYEYEYEPFTLPAMGGASSLSVEFDEHQAIQDWPFTFPLEFKFRRVGGTDWQKQSATFNVELQHEFHLSRVELPDPHAQDDLYVPGMRMEGELFVPYGNTSEVSHVSGLPATLTADEAQRINAFVADTVKRAILGKFYETLTARTSETFLQKARFIGENRLEPSDLALPFDQLVCGELRSSDSTFFIVEHNALVAAGQTQQFTTQPPLENVEWAVESFEGNTSDPGSIDQQTGLYKAPPGHAIEGTYNEVMIVARDPLGEHALSVALLTIQVNPITINPLIQVLAPEQRVELTAGHIGAGELEWSIKNPIEGESGQLVVSDLPGGDHAYIAAPFIAGKTYVLEEIGVQSNEGAHSSHVLVVHSLPSIEIKQVHDHPVPGQIKLATYINNNPYPCDWSLPIEDQGSIDAEGVYSDKNTKARFVFIRAHTKVEDMGDFEGYLILPLPLANFPTVINELAPLHDARGQNHV